MSAYYRASGRVWFPPKKADKENNSASVDISLSIRQAFFFSLYLCPLFKKRSVGKEILYKKINK